VNSFPIRSALVVLALVAGAWLALGVRAVVLQEDAEAVIEQARAGPIPRARISSALDDLAKAGRLSPDQTPLISQGELLLSVGRLHDAQVAAQRAIAAEPENLQARFLAWQLADANSPAKEQAKLRVLALNPWFKYALRHSPRPALPDRGR
jgi:hypothetical protein